MKAEEIRKMTPGQRREKLQELRDELTYQQGSVQSLVRAGNPGKIKPLKKDIARILTVMREEGD